MIKLNIKSVSTLVGIIIIASVALVVFAGIFVWQYYFVSTEFEIVSPFLPETKLTTPITYPKCDGFSWNSESFDSSPCDWRNPSGPNKGGVLCSISPKYNLVFTCDPLSAASKSSNFLSTIKDKILSYFQVSAAAFGGYLNLFSEDNTSKQRYLIWRGIGDGLWGINFEMLQNRFLRTNIGYSGTGASGITSYFDTENNKNLFSLYGDRGDSIGVDLTREGVGYNFDLKYTILSRNTDTNSAKISFEDVLLNNKNLNVFKEPIIMENVQLVSGAAAAYFPRLTIVEDAPNSGFACYPSGGDSSVLEKSLETGLKKVTIVFHPCFGEDKEILRFTYNFETNKVEQ